MTSASPDRLDEVPWRQAAACRGADITLFFPPERLAQPTRERLQRQAAAVCRSCSVRPTCLAYSIVTEQRHGIWGGVAADGGGPLGLARDATGDWTCANCATVNPQRRRRCTDCGTTRV